jgi:CHASE3 domain sensor protein
MAVACGVLALLVGGAFVFLLVTVTDLRHSTELRQHTREELRAADALEKLVIDLETGLRGFVITREERFLAPWKAARVALPGQAAALEHLVAKDPVQLGRVRRIARDAASYVRDYEALRGNARAQIARLIRMHGDPRRRFDGLCFRCDGGAGDRRWVE